MNYVLVGINHKKAPVEIREKMALDAEGSHRVLDSLIKYPAIKEATVISTCNRVEFYSASDDPEEASHVLRQVLVEPLEDQSEVSELFYCKKDHEVVTHLFGVASSLDSQVMGENQITGQVKEAYKLAQRHSATGFYLNKLFDRALYVAKRVKSETDISQGNISIGSVGMTLAKKIFGTLKDKSVLLLGAGKLGELAVRYLNTEQVKQTYIFNRTFEKAKKLEDQGLGIACQIDELSEILTMVDVLITSVSGTVEELSADVLRKLMQKRKNQPLFIIDLGVPRNVQDEVSGIDNLYLYNIDDLQGIADENENSRLNSMNQAKNIIDEEVVLFYEKQLEFKVLPAITSLGKKFEQIRIQELNKTVSKLPNLSKKDRAAIDKLTQALVSRVLHDPILSLRNKKEMSEPAVLSIFKKLFRLDDED